MDAVPLVPPPFVKVRMQVSPIAPVAVMPEV
jgi:hypothetical protein